MSEKTLYLAWESRQPRPAWYPVGRLDANVEESQYRFRYTGGAKRAQEVAGFPLLMEFPSLDKEYKASKMFPLFDNRVMNSKRPEFAAHLLNLGLTENADPVEILAINGGRRVTDAYEVFPKIEKTANGKFTCRFFLHGWRYVNQSSRERITQIEEGDKLYLTLEMANPATGRAVQVQTMDYYMIGWVPRYLVYDLFVALKDDQKYSARVVRVNSVSVPTVPPVPHNLRVLIELKSQWQNHDPMDSEDYQPLVC